MTAISALCFLEVFRTSNVGDYAKWVRSGRLRFPCLGVGREGENILF